MSTDPLLAIAPARVKALLLPLGKIKAERFTPFVQRLQQEHVVHLKDISADGRPNRNMFSPLAYRDGAMIYDLITHIPPPSQLVLSPFDLYREPLALIALADGKELQDATFSKRRSTSGATAATTVERNIRALEQELEALRDNYPKALVHHVIVFDYSAPPGSTFTLPDGIVTVPPIEQCKRTTLKTVMCDISSLLLAEMTTLAKSFEALPTIDSPGTYESANHTNGHSWGNSNGASEGTAQGSQGVLARRNSQLSIPRKLSRSSSTMSTVAEKVQTRMSMPAILSRSSSNATATTARPSTPPRTGLAVTPMTPDGGHSGASTGTSTPEPKPAKEDKMDKKRDASRDRVSVQGFGSGGANDKNRLRGKGRISVLIGSMYLQAGRWNDSIKELVAGAATARSLNDHIWHGKALELILMNLLLLGWSNLEFQVPSVCLPAQERPVSMVASLIKSDDAGDPSQPKHLRQLQNLLPELLDRILGLYSRISSENLPPLPLAETTIRFCKILSAVHLSHGKLDQDAFKAIVTGQLPSHSLTTSPRLAITPTRRQIVDMLFKAFPAAGGAELLTVADKTSILSGIANLLGPLGLHRKKAMVIRELVSVLIAGLVEARTRGAAEAGVHPAAGLVSFVPGSEKTSAAGVALDLGEGDIEHGIEAFLDLLCKSYGVVAFDMRRSSSRHAPEGTDTDAKVDDSDEATMARVLAQSTTRFFGFTEIKVNILRACINFSEALPDFNGVLRFSSDLLRTAGSGIAPGPKREDATPHIHREEQVRLVGNIARTASLATRIGLPPLTAEYWDEFLVRGISLEPLPNSRIPIPHAKGVLPDTVPLRASQDVNPFIYNPFLKEPEEVPAENLVADELATFRLTLQNTYDVDVEMESIRLDTEGVAFESIPESAILGPYRTQLVRLQGRPKEAGPITVTGAFIKIRGCRERRFPVFSKHWVPCRAEKIKSKGLSLPPAEGPEDGATAAAATTTTAGTVPSPPQAKLQTKVLKLNVVRPQPMVVIKSTSLGQSSVMLLEGERQVFTVTMQNTSSTPVDFMLFSFRDSTQGPLQAAMDKRDATSAELYEYEWILMKKQALRLPKADQSRHIAPGGEATFEYEILGKPGLTHATIQADYTYLGIPRDQMTEPFHTRQVLLDLTVTVNASVEVSRIDAVPLPGPVPVRMLERLSSGGTSTTSPDDYFLLAIDLRNAWPSQISIRLQGEDGILVEDALLPGKTSRVVMPMKKIYIEDAHEAVPSLNPCQKRQFVVSTSQISPEMERANREAFWYRERLLQQLQATWRTTSTPSERTGVIELRNMRLTRRMIDVIKVDEVDMVMWVEGGSENKQDSRDGDGDGDDGENSARHHQAVVYVDEFMQLKVRVTNRTLRPISAVIRLMPSLCHRPLHVALDHTRKFAWNGALQQRLPELKGHESTEFVMGATALCRGQFEVGASVEEVEVHQVLEEEEKEEKKEQQQQQQQKDKTNGRTRSESQVLMEGVLGGRERRIWHSRRDLMLTVRDAEAESMERG
ncbi:hypothetical protein E4U13_003472 [Claviceps humidiphila]|uniref:Hypercellular protein HypA n=1 Tax=Claviceps humidiphila TaxID=1294629 RepID=A0A9P7TWI2_9HYPO|nr:hypothetical protein E4U13_003472 [Claviceps humidiphila]